MTAERYDAFVSYGHGDADTELSAEDFDRVWEFNARGVFLGLRAVLRVMKPQRSGSIVNTASMVAIRGAATFSPYVASKHAVAGLTCCAALEGADGPRADRPDRSLRSGGRLQADRGPGPAVSGATHLIDGALNA